MTHELRIERLLDAPPELVFDTLLGPDAQEDLYNGQLEGWGLLSWEMDLREGGTWTIVYGPEDGSGEPDRLTSVFTEVDRPRRLSYDLSMFVGEWGRTVDSSVTYTFEERDGGTSSRSCRAASRRGRFATPTSTGCPASWIRSNASSPRGPLDESRIPEVVMSDPGRSTAGSMAR